MKKKILITGANGFVGYHLVKEALEMGLEVFAGVRKGSDLSYLKDFGVQFSYLNYDNLNELKINFLFRQYDFIVHAAGATKAANEREYYHINADYTKNIATAATFINPEKFLLLSSLAALGPTNLNDLIGLHPDTNPRPVTSYGRSKLKAEMITKEFQNLRWNIIRPTAVYGPREKDLLMLIKMINRGIEIYLGKDKQILSFVHVEDLAKIVIKACTSKKVKECYNISDGNIYSTEKLSGLVKKELRKKTIKITLPITFLRLIIFISAKVNKRKPSILNEDKLNELVAESWNCDISKLKNDFDFKAQFNLESGMKHTIKWYKINKWIN